MNIQGIREIMCQCLEAVGIFITSEESLEDLDLRSYIEDSLQFISFIVELENRLNVEIPDEFLQIDHMGSMNAFCEMLSELVE